MTAGGDLAYSGSVADLTLAVRSAIPADSGPVAISRASGERLSAAAVGFAIVECPVVRGRTVWAAAPADTKWALVESPNAVGRLGSGPGLAGGAVLVTAPGAPRPDWDPCSAMIVPPTGHIHVYSRRPVGNVAPPEFAVAAARFASRTKEAGKLAKQLNQLPGVHLAHGSPDSPRFVVLLPVAGTRIGDGAAGSSAPITAWAGAAPSHLPGAVTIEVASEPSTGERAAFLSAIEQLIR